jgi:superfamily II RNA helicase
VARRRRSSSPSGGRPPRPGAGKGEKSGAGTDGSGLIGGGSGASAKGRSGSRRKKPSPPEASTGPRETFRDLTLNDFQMQALGPLREGRPVLLAAPTGAGKTLVAEMAIDMSLKKGMRAIYTAPIKALSNQKYRDFKAIDPDMVGLMTGDVTINPAAPLLIMTTEIFRNTIFENPASLADVETVVFDEIHYMDDPERGTVWEESIIFAPPHVRFVCLSATISNLTQYGEWIGQVRGQDVEIIRHAERPVPLDHYLYFPGSGMKRVEHGKVKFPAGHGEKPDRNRRGQRGRGRGKGKDGERNAVIEVLRRAENLPVLFFCFSRRECESRALEASKGKDLLDEEAAATMAGLFDKTVAAFEIEPDAELEELRSLVRRGIGYHHAGMLPLHKELVERLFTSGLLRLLFATETFSLGINMPARSVVFAALRKFDGTGFGPLKVREYQQMAGRAGRQGIDEQGIVVSIVDDHRVQPKDVDHMIGNDVEPIVSRFNLSYATLINLHATLGERLHEAWERSFNNYQWARMSKKRREKNEAKQREAIDRRMTLLRELGYVTDEGVTPKGKMAAVINGFELPVVELYDSGLLEWLDETQLAVVFAALTFEERKNDLFRRLPPSVMGPHRKDVERCIGRLVSAERECGIPASIKAPNFKIGIVVRDWCRGSNFADMRDQTTAPSGDLVRIMRLTVQLLRQLRGALPRGSPLIATLDRSRDLLNRDAVDAARQLSLG